jgi:hypothetical protein
MEIMIRRIRTALGTSMRMRGCEYKEMQKARSAFIRTVTSIRHIVISVSRIPTVSSPVDYDPL